jgi:L-asparaginase II
MNFESAVEVRRGGLVESVHFAAAAVVNKAGELVAALGNPETVTFLRSSAKPFQAIPLVSGGAAGAFQFSDREIALTCASHSGTDAHVEVARGILSKIGLSESALQCGCHVPSDPVTADRLKKEGVAPTPIRHNCSGKHAGMLAQAVHCGQSPASYLEIDSDVQAGILDALASLAGMEPDEIKIGIDGCSAPNFALPLLNVARAYANLLDPDGFSPALSQACRRIHETMTAHPEMVSGIGRFDTKVMQVTRGRILSKEGAEGYQGFGLIPGAIHENSPALGIGIKIADGGYAHRARSIVSLAVLRAIGAIGDAELAELDAFGPYDLTNDQGLRVGEVAANFKLERFFR